MLRKLGKNLPPQITYILPDYDLHITAWFIKITVENKRINFSYSIFLDHPVSLSTQWLKSPKKQSIGVYF